MLEEREEPELRKLAIDQLAAGSCWTVDRSARDLSSSVVKAVMASIPE